MGLNIEIVASKSLLLFDPTKKNSGFLKSQITEPSFTKSGTYENPKSLPYNLPDKDSTRGINLLVIVPGKIVDDKTIK